MRKLWFVIDAATVTAILSLLAWHSGLPAKWLGAARVSPAMPTAPLMEAVTVPIGRTPILGRIEASVIIFQYSDFTCPYSRQFATTVLPVLIRDYVDGGDVALVFRNFPLKKHPSAVRAAQAALCADEQGEFWKMHDLVLGSPLHLLTDSGLDGLAAEIPLDKDRYSACVNGESSAAIERDIAEGRHFGIDATPTFLVGRNLFNGTVQIAAGLRGVQSLETFARTIDRVRESRTAGRPAPGAGGPN